MFSAVVVLVNLKVLISSNKIEFWNLFWIFGSIASFYIFFGVLASFHASELYGVFEELWDMPETYLLLFFAGTSYLLIDSGISATNAEYNSVRQLRFEKLEHIVKEKEIKREETLRASSYMKHRPIAQSGGFAYSGDTGNAPLVTDTLRNRFMNAFASQLSIRMELEKRKAEIGQSSEVNAKLDLDLESYRGE